MDDIPLVSLTKNDILIAFISWGYATEEIKINGRRNINIRLREDTKALDEVVVIGYGQPKKRERRGIHEFGKAFGNRCPDSKI